MQHLLAQCCTSSPGQVCLSRFHFPCTQWWRSASGISLSNTGRNLVRMVTHPVTEKMTSVGCCNFNRFHEPTVWPSSSVAFSEDNWRVTFKNSSRSFLIWIVLQLQICTAHWTIIQWLVRSPQFYRDPWLARGKHSWLVVPSMTLGLDYKELIHLSENLILAKGNN